NEVGTRAQLLARREQRRQLAEREQSGHVWKGRMPDRRCSGDDLEGREGEDDYRGNRLVAGIRDVGAGDQTERRQRLGRVGGCREIMLGGGSVLHRWVPVWGESDPSG